MPETPEIHEVKSWPDFTTRAAQLDIGSPMTPRFAFRGQGIADWQLVPSFTRLALSLNPKAEQAIKIEDTALQEFQKQAHLHLPPGNAQMLRHALVPWWIIMQHYRAPTRILDWTLSPFIALYFAVGQEPNHCGAVWALDVRTVLKHLREKYGAYKVPVSEEDYKKFKDPNAESNLHFGEHLVQTDRMLAQQTLSSVSPQVMADHGYIIAESLSHDAEKPLFVKMLIPAKLKPEFMRHLRAMNVTGRALFPGADGIGMSVAELIELGCRFASGDVGKEPSKES